MIETAELNRFLLELDVQGLPTDWFEKKAHVQPVELTVFGEGNSNSPLIAFVSEGLVIQEDARQLLNDAIEKGLGLKKEDIYICNITNQKSPKNLKSQQLDLIKPKIIVSLGETPLLEIGSKEVEIGKLRGKWCEWRAIPVMPTYHPAYILNNPSAKKPFWADLQEVMKHLGI